MFGGFFLLDLFPLLKSLGEICPGMHSPVRGSMKQSSCPLGVVVLGALNAPPLLATQDWIGYSQYRYWLSFVLGGVDPCGSVLLTQ